MFLCRVVDKQKTKKFQRLNHTYALDFGQPIVFDLKQDYRMSDGEASSFVQQMRGVYAANRTMWEPFQLHLCGYDPGLPGMRDLVESEQSRHYLWNVTEDCFSRLFPRERLVYLSPDAPELASEWRHDDVYVIGGVVDKSDRGGKMTLSKIKSLGIRSQRFDIDRYFKKRKVIFAFHGVHSPLVAL